MNDLCVRVVLVLALAGAVFANAAEPVRDAIDLAGQWAIRLDRDDVGQRQQWFARPLGDDAVKLPGSLQAQGYGDPVTVDTPWTGTINDRSWFDSPRYAPYRQAGNVKVPFWLQPERHYVGAAWYQRAVTIPERWRGRRITLLLERCHWQTTVWVDQTEIGSRDSLATPHVYDLTEHLAPGQHRLTIRVDNRLKYAVGVNAHSVTDHTQTNWNGIIGRIELQASDAVWIDDVQVYPDVARRTARLRITIGTLLDEPVRGTVTAQAAPCDEAAGPVEAQQAGFALAARQAATVELEYPLGKAAALWDEFHPSRYRLDVRLSARAGHRTLADRRLVQFGMRRIEPRGTQLAVNGRPIFLRGTLECCIFPLTGYPPTDVESWKRVIRRCKMHGLNHMRFHSWCPPEAAFAAADQLGFYFHVECGLWANQGSTIGDGKPVDRFLWAEQARILRWYGNHPSFVMLAYGNEPAGRNQKRFLGQLVEHWKKTDPRRVYTSAAGWPIIPENQYHSTPAPRIQAWGAGLRSRINARPPETMTDYRDVVARYDVPVVAHEIGQWCVYPNFDEMAKYRGVLKPRNFEIFRDFLQQNHMGDLARDFLMASGKLQVLCYKEEIESALRTPGFGGFQLLDLHDFPGQGTALVGVLDPFWDSKPYVSPDQFRRFCNQTVPLARMARRVWTAGQALESRIEVAHYGPADLERAVVRWRLEKASGGAIAEGSFPPTRIRTGTLCPIGTVCVPLERTQPPARLRLVVAIEGTAYENDWDVWVYPDWLDTAPPDGVLVARDLDDPVFKRLAGGGQVLLVIDPHRVRTGATLGFSSIFWNTAWTRGQPPHTLGILCDPHHPALAGFPTEYHTNWQWWYLVSRAAAMELDRLPPRLRPIVAVIDTWFESRRLGLVFEARVGRGKLVVTSIDLVSDLAENPVARQLRRSLLDYMASDAFQPEHEVDFEVLRGLMRPLSAMEKLGATATADSAQPGYEAARVLDGDPATIWHTPWGKNPKRFPHYVVVDLKRPRQIVGLAYLPRQDMTNGRIGRYAIYLSSDGINWDQPVAAGRWPNARARQVVQWDQPRTARYVKVQGETEVSGKPWASAAELEVILAQP